MSAADKFWATCTHTLIVPFSVFIPWQALERELAPVEERLSKLGRMTRKVTASNPQEGRQVQARHSEITGLWDKLKVSEILLLFCVDFSEWLSKCKIGC